MSASRFTDERLDALARELREPAPSSELLWARIDAALEVERDRRAPSIAWAPLVAVAAGLLCVALLLGREGARPESPLLATTEVSHLDAELGRLENRLAQLEPRFAASRLELRASNAIALRTRVASLRSNVERCRAAAAMNRHNRVVQHSLVDSTRRMVETLESALASEDT